MLTTPSCFRGSRFRYTNYYPDPTVAPSAVHATQLTNSTKSSVYQSTPIHASISALDHEAIDILSIPTNTAVKDAHNAFATYLTKTKNTICGRHPIGVLLGALEYINSKYSDKRDTISMHWVRYEQSSQCISPRDSSVSYASAYVTF
jgi:MEMO1 family protein